MNIGGISSEKCGRGCQAKPQKQQTKRDQKRSRALGWLGHNKNYRVALPMAEAGMRQFHYLSHMHLSGVRTVSS